jgi:hypothetical protein
MGARAHNFDKLLELKDAGAITASAAAQVAAANRILDMGAARFEGVVKVNVTAIDISSADEVYDLFVQGSNSSTFASGIENLAALNLGAAALALRATAQASVAGIYEISVTNEQADVTYRYIRMFTRVAGTTPSINYTAFLTSEFGG